MNIKKFYGQSTATGGGSEEPIDKILLDRYFSNTLTGVFMEAGANDGLFLTSCKLFEDIGWAGINIEPSRKLYQKLKENRSRSININIALSNKQDTVIFEDIDFDNGGFSRIADSERHLQIDRQFNIKVNNKYPVPTDTYENILKIYNINSINLFVLDVEGFELEVIEGMGNDIAKKPEIFCIEHTHVGLDKLKEKLKDEYIYDWSDTLNVIFVRK
jgi:FkbM family methyltransferase